MAAKNQIPSVSETQTSDVSISNTTLDPSLNPHNLETYSVSRVLLKSIHVLPQLPTDSVPSTDPPQPATPNSNIFRISLPIRTHPVHTINWILPPPLITCMMQCRAFPQWSPLIKIPSIHSCILNLWLVQTHVAWNYNKSSTWPNLFPNAINNSNLPPTTSIHLQSIRVPVGEGTNTSLNTLLSQSLG